MTIEIKTRLTKEAFQLRLDLSMPGKGITAVFGHSGSGKTTLLRLIAGFDKAPETEVIVNGVVWQNALQSLPTHKRRVGYVFQEARLFEHLSVGQNLRYGVKRLSHEPDAGFFDEVVALLGLEKWLPRDPRFLSGGEKQRVALARALLSKPKLLLMDEPLASLDYQAKKDILPYLEKLHQRLDIPIIYVSHSADEIVHLADYLVVLKKGAVAVQGPFLETVSQPDNPMSKSDAAFSVIEAVVKTSDDEAHLSHLEMGKLTLRLPVIDKTQGAKVRLRVMAKDVSISLEQAHNSSILNILPAVIEDMELIAKGQVRLGLRVDKQRILSRVSQYSAANLNLNVGDNVYAQVKGMAIIRPSL